MKIILTGGGTGGHTTPGIALAQRIEQEGSQALFLVSTREVDVHLMQRYGFKAVHLATTSFTRNPATWPQFLVDGVKVFQRARRAIDDFGPDAVVGLGGYVSFFPLLAARLRRLPIVLLEQNVIPGKVTRRMAPLAAEVCCQWQETMRFLSVKVHARVTGNPVRTEVLAATRDAAFEQMQLDPGNKTLLVLGGSQAAHALNAMMIRSAAELAREAPGLQVIHLAGKADCDQVSAAYRQAGVTARVFDFLDDVTAYRAADVALSRAGGSTIAELTACGIPLILVPYPFATDDHQRCNARSLAESGAAVVLEQSAFTPPILVGIIRKFLDDAGLAKRMHQASLDRGRPGAAADIVAKLRTFVRPNATNITVHDLRPEPVGKEQP